MNYFGLVYSNLVKAVIVTVISGCITLAAHSAVDDKTLVNLETQRWMLEEIEGQPALAKSSNDGMGELGKPYLEMDLSKNQFSGMASCNLITGKVSHEKKIKFSWETSTALTCRESLMKQERNFLELLSKITRFEQSEQFLHLYVEDQLVLKFNLQPNLIVKSGCGTAIFNNQKKQDLTKQIPANLKLETAKWLLAAVEGKPLPNIETELFINFDKSTWGISGSSGCHTFSGGYKTGADRLNIDAFEPLIKLPIRCNQERLTVQIKFLESLSRVYRFEIKAGKLDLYDDSDKLLLTFEAEK